jgi:hypothetical protein
MLIQVIMLLGLSNRKQRPFWVRKRLPANKTVDHSLTGPGIFEPL